MTVIRNYGMIIVTDYDLDSSGILVGICVSMFTMYIRICTRATVVHPNINIRDTDSIGSSGIPGKFGKIGPSIQELFPRNFKNCSD